MVHEPPAATSTPTSSPAIVDRQDLEGYEKTNTPFPFTNPEDKSLKSYVDRIHRFIVDLMSLPWTDTQVTNDYSPALDSSRGRYRKSDVRVSWYTPRGGKKQTLDRDITSTSMSGSVVPQIMIQTIPPTPTYSGAPSYYTQNPLTLTVSPVTYVPSQVPSSGGLTAVRPLRTPGTATSGGLPSPGASSHGFGDHSVSYSYHYASPQAYRGQPPAMSAISSPQTRLESESYFSPPPR
ncbi:hypothetical protein K474DRAFT_975688 [Panus rudis PR-1116 ss-1]|nr:hypothetical protein K474DRAFT_975688 [Panus rudis PR-1116 ss-1]